MLIPTDGKSGSRVSFHQTLVRLGLTANLALCLDAGDVNSYNPAVQTNKWLDTSGNGYDFYRGSGTGSDAADPTFNGAAGGLSSAEFFSLDGGDYFTYDSANETWMNALHKDSAVLSWLLWTWVADLGGQSGLLGTSGNSNSSIGFDIGVVGTGRENPMVRNGSGTSALSLSNSAVLTTSGVWCCFAGAIDEGAGAGNLVGDGGSASTSPTYSSPSASNATYPMQIGARGNGVNPMRNGSKISMVAMWSGVALSSSQITSVLMATRPRFGI